MTPTIRFEGPEISKDELQAFEQQYGVTFPHDYRSFLLTFNGGMPFPNVFKFDWRGYDVYAHVGRFLGIAYPAALFSMEWNAKVIRPRLPQELFIISKDHTGSRFHLVCLCIQGGDFGKIYYVPQYDDMLLSDDDEDEDKEESEDTGPDYTNAYFLADSFTSFLDHLAEPPSGLFPPSVWDQLGLDS